MATLLIWTDDGETLTIIDSHQVEDGDQAAIDELFEDAAERNGADNGCAFDVDRHSDAVQRAYEEYAQPLRLVLVDDVEGHKPATY
ncbi:hypothetical protein [Streptomyces sp. MZ04]|uniref:hypothetical protein n=1 Tax=Streptomyces sp. MZ04 TaxID=2559236 RepID=UPI00107E76CE|nr:hypothetical protein [Streptomyces sp. MZ04]TGB03220.1 hypothetical protein E2651_25670 [Streptomyces sp. MZ04]